MTGENISRFVLRAVAAGLVAAVAVFLLWPEKALRPVVELRTSAEVPPLARPVGPVSYAEAVGRAAPAVVNIYTSKTITRKRHPLLDDPFFRQFFDAPRKQTQTSLGSGVIISEQGYVLTNNHVIEGADEIRLVLTDGRHVQGQIVGTDPETDLAVLEIELDDLPAIIVGRSDKLQVGDVVLAIGNPFGVGKTVTQGIVSATGRNQLGINTIEDFIQTDAAINPGNSGGALINAYGELVGINTVIFSKSGGSQGIGFAIPAALAQDVMTQIIENGQVIRGWLGVEVQDINPQLAESFGLQDPNGVAIAGVVSNSPADRAGLEPGDIIVRLDGEAVANAREALHAIAHHHPGGTLHIAGLRGRRPFETEARVAQRPVIR